jgi:hypothetical protein
MRYPVILALAASLIVGVAGKSVATVFTYTATITGLQEVPPNASPGIGTGFLSYDDVANALTTNISFSGLVAGTIAAHIHGGAAYGANAPIVRPFASAPLGVTSGSFTDVWTGLTPTQVGYLNGSLLYINLHTSAFTGGEIRGQIIPESATSSRAVTWGKIKALYR